jgi:hypothetical protein
MPFSRARFALSCSLINMRYPAPSATPAAPNMTRLRLLLAAFSLLAATALIAACGGGGEDRSSLSPGEVLDQTFSADNEQVESADVDLKLKVDVAGKQAGTIDATLSGPFESQGSKEIPKFDLKASVQATGQAAGSDLDFDGGLTSTGDSAFVNYKGSDYQVDQTIFDAYKKQVESAASDNTENQSSITQLLKRFGIDDPKDLLTNLSNKGTVDVDGTETTQVSGDLDVAKLVDGLKGLSAGAGILGTLGGGASQLPDPAELDQLKDSIKEAHFDIYSGNDDHILRRIKVVLSIAPTTGTTDQADVNFDLTLGSVNESQSIEAPSNPKPFSELLSALGVDANSLGALGNLGLGVGGGTSGAGSTGGTPATPDTNLTPEGESGGGGGAGQNQEAINCLTNAKTAADLQKCEALLK